MIPEELNKDVEILKKRGFIFEIVENNSIIYIAFKNFPLPFGLYNHDEIDLLIFTTTHYPNAGFDMFWTDHTITLKNGDVPKQADSVEPHLGKSWRRFSYHPYNTDFWNPAVDNVGRFVEYVQQRLRNGD